MIVNFMKNEGLIIDSNLVQELIASQFPQWKDLPIRPIAMSGWDNRTFHLGKDMLMRLPSAAEYALQVEKEHQWLPKLAPFLPLEIPTPLAMGKPGCGFPWKWSIYRWIDGNSAQISNIADLCEFAKSLARFLLDLEKIDSTGGPLPGRHSFHRGGSLSIYDGDTRKAIAALNGKIDDRRAIEIWETALKTSWNQSFVWVHGDLSIENLLVRYGKLHAVIDFGQLTIGDPACDLVITWTFFQGKSREIFRSMFPFDRGTWARARAWTLWKALITAAGFTDSKNSASSQCWRILTDVLDESRE